MTKLAQAFLPITMFAKNDVKRLFRDKVAIFFVFLFPLIFLLMFGSIFNGGDVSFRVAILNNSTTDFAAGFVAAASEDKVLKVNKTVTDMDTAKQKMSRGQLDATIVITEQFGAVQSGQEYPSGTVKIVYGKNNEQAGTTLVSIVDGIFKGINKQVVPTSVTPFVVEAAPLTTAGLTQFDYVFAGTLGLTLVSLGIFGPGNVFPRLKQRGVLRRYHTTPLKKWQYFTSNVLSNMFIGLIAVAIMFVAALIIFDLDMRGSYLNLAVIVLLGTVMLFGIGMSIGGWAKNENQAAALTQVIALPMMFLSGVFLPTFMMPVVLQNISQFIPLTPIVDSMRLIITENASLVDLAPQIGLIAGWTIIVYILAIKIFRWE